jgi:hypothetical protein
MLIPIFLDDICSREQLQRRIAATDKKIDRLIYNLYDLPGEEIAIVEENT